jgi:NhaP-type Na+/H+ or K+/H+ antiporter
MVALGVFVATLLTWAALSRPLASLSVTPQILVMAAGLGLALLRPADSNVGMNPEILRVVGELALIMALFVDASRSNIAALRRSALVPTRLLAVGLPLTIAAGWLAAAVLVPGIDAAGALVLAVLVAPTDAALGALVVNSPAVPVRVRQALNVESGLNDGLVTPLVLVATAISAADGASTGRPWILDAATQIAIGAAAGIVIGVGGGALLRVAGRMDLVISSARWIIAPALAVLSWIVAQALGGNAFVAAFVAGLCLTIAHGPVRTAYLEFAEGFGELAGLAVFFLVGALLTTVSALNPAILVFAVLALTIVRMLPVAVSLAGSGLSLPSVAFIGWFGPRGLATVVLGLMALGDGVPLYEDAPIAAAVITTVTLSVVLHGLSAGPLVARYGRFAERLAPGAAELDETIEIATRAAALRGGRAAAEAGSEPRSLSD